jgi:hypothetical protein
MLTFTFRRLLLAIPTLVLISLIIFLLLDLAPGDPLADQPLSIPPEVRQKMRDALGLDSPAYVRYLLWAKQFFWVEPLVFVDWVAGTSFSEGMQRIVSWQFRAPVFDIIIQRLPQTLWVVGLAYLVGVMIALPIGIISAYKQYSWFDQIGTFISMIGFSVPPFFSGVLVIVIFAIMLPWFPSIYDTTLVVNDWESFGQQIKQMIMPVMVLALQTTSADQPLHARLDARQPQSGLRAHRARQGHDRESRAPGPRAAQLDDPGGHRYRAGHPVNLRRRHHHRADLQGERAGAAADHRDPGQRPADGADADLHLRGADRAVQPDRRRALRPP